MFALGFFGGYGIGFVIALLIAVWVATDANKRGMNGLLWAIGVFLVCIVFLPIYLIVRKPLLSQQPSGYPPPGPPLPPPAGRHFCSNCGAPVETGVKFCGNCGKPA